MHPKNPKCKSSIFESKKTIYSYIRVVTKQTSNNAFQCIRHTFELDD